MGVEAPGMVGNDLRSVWEKGRPRDSGHSHCFGAVGDDFALLRGPWLASFDVCAVPKRMMQDIVGQGHDEPFGLGGFGDCG